jgi:NaMN:DMB phosphoribosyltransferase
VIKALNPEALCNVAVGTTRWVAKDKSSDLTGIVTQFCDVPVLAADLDFGSSKFPGLRIYETGLVKEGVGAGGASIAAMSKLGGAVTKEILLKEIERNYALLMSVK